MNLNHNDSKKINKKICLNNNDMNLYEKIPEIEIGFPVKVRKYVSSVLQPHWHEHLEILYILKGEGKFNCGSTSVFAKEGDAVVINCNEQHSFFTENSIEYICIIISPSFFRNVDFDNIILKSVVKGDEEVGDYIKKIYDAYKNNLPGDDMEILSQTYGLTAHLVKKYVSVSMTGSEYEARIAKVKKVNTVLDYIHNHYNEKLTTAYLADKFYLSSSYFCHIFKDVVGKTVIEYINEYRIEKASVMLKNTEEAVSKIAEEVGFENHNYFDRIFLRLKGVPPTEYKKVQ